MFNVKLHQLFSFHSTAAKLLPRTAANRENRAEGKVDVTPAIREAMIDIFAADVDLAIGGKARRHSVAAFAGISPRKHQLAELEPLIARLPDYSLAIEFRNRNWVVGDQ